MFKISISRESNGSAYSCCEIDIHLTGLKFDMHVGMSARRDTERPMRTGHMAELRATSE